MNFTDCEEDRERYQLMFIIRNNFQDSTLINMERAINRLLDDEKVTGGKFVQKHQECFLIRSGIDAVLDLSRENYNILTDKVYEVLFLHELFNSNLHLYFSKYSWQMSIHKKIIF